MKTLFCFLFLLAACDDNDYEKYKHFKFHVDPACLPEHVADIRRGVLRINELTGELIDQPLVDLTDDVRDSPIVCHYEKPEWYDTLYPHDVVLGDAGYEGEHINLYLFYSDINVLNIIMHELMHSLGVKAHVDDPHAVMYPIIGKSTTYTDADKKIFCVYWDCEY